MHEPEIYKGHNTKDATHWQWLQQTRGKPVYMQEVDPLIPDSVAYPLKEAQELAGVNEFGTTFAYMAALAILQGYEEVQIYGIELSVTEYKYQVESYKFWFGFLRGRLGDKITSTITHIGNNIFAAPLYGYEGNFALGSDYFADRARRLDGSWKSEDKNLTNIKKAIERAIDNKDFENVQRLTLDYQKAAIMCGQTAGALSEAQRYQTFGERYADRGGFEHSAASAQKEGEEKKPLVWHYGGMAEYVWNVWRQSKGAQGAGQVKELIFKMGTTAYDMGAQLGAYQENILYINKYDSVVQANGGLK
ncbi:MAG: hypothetical protein NUV80_07555 [Candidatus Berkelbacteria bacterium]|nr:hypothetical protein [Candidatus Berkelbacteria bacterium]